MIRNRLTQLKLPEAAGDTHLTENIRNYRIEFKDKINILKVYAALLKANFNFGNRGWEIRAIPAPVSSLESSTNLPMYKL